MIQRLKKLVGQDKGPAANKPPYASQPEKLRSRPPTITIADSGNSAPRTIKIKAASKEKQVNNGQDQLENDLIAEVGAYSAPSTVPQPPVVLSPLADDLTSPLPLVVVAPSSPQSPKSSSALTLSSLSNSPSPSFTVSPEESPHPLKKLETAENKNHTDGKKEQTSPRRSEPPTRIFAKTSVPISPSKQQQFPHVGAPPRDLPPEFVRMTSEPLLTEGTQTRPRLSRGGTR